jgi:hypothetical protein
MFGTSTKQQKVLTHVSSSFAPLVMLAMPFIEIAGFVIVGSHIGVFATLGLVILSAMLGFFRVSARKRPQAAFRIVKWCMAPCWFWLRSC